MRVRIDIARGGGVSMRIDDAGPEEVRRFLGGDGSIGIAYGRSGKRSRVTPEMVEAGVQAFLGQGDAARLGRAMVSVYEAMERARRKGSVADE